MVKNPPVNSGGTGLIPGWGRSPGGGNGNRFQCTCLENSMDRGAWWAPGRQESDTTEQLSTHMHACGRGTEAEPSHVWLTPKTGVHSKAPADRDAPSRQPGLSPPIPSPAPICEPEAARWMDLSCKSPGAQTTLTANDWKTSGSPTPRVPGPSAQHPLRGGEEKGSHSKRSWLVTCCLNAVS